MKLQILIPQYKETDEIVKPLLDSIAIQQNVDFNEVGVIIVNDGTDIHLSDELIKGYPFKIEYYLNEHKGVSSTRNACLDKATADYVMFCDADDMFFSVTALWMLFREMDISQFDSFVSVFVEETRTPDRKQIVYIERGRLEQGGVDSTFVHGKVQRRQYLLDEKIRWNDSLTIHEDSYFNILCQKCASPEKVRYCPMPFYLWKWRDESVCRNDFKYILKTYNNMLDSNTALIKEFIRRNKMDLASFYTTAMIYDAYFTLNTDSFLNGENVEFKNAVEKRFKKYWQEFRTLYESIDQQIKSQIIISIKNRFFQEGLLMESITFDDWIKKINNI